MMNAQKFLKDTGEQFYMADYAKKVAEIIDGEVQVVEKANGVRRIGVTKRIGEMAPIVYLTEYHDKGLTPEEAAKEVMKVIESNIRDNDMSWIYDWETAKRYIKARLYNQQTNADVYRSAKRYGFDDLIIVPYLTNVIPDGHIKVIRQLADVWGVTDDEIIKVALDNVKIRDVTIQSMFEVLSGMMGDEIDPDDFPDDVPMLVVSNKERCFGAIGVIKAKAKLKRKLKDGYVVIPSSIHEVIVVNKGQMPPEALNDIINSVNDECVMADEVLGNKAYVF